MTTVSKQLLLEQWKTLHNNHESYEQYALVIKLVSVIITITALVFSINILTTIFLLAILWLQEGIWKTFQSRAANAIITIENRLSDIGMKTEDDINEESLQPYLFYKDWQESRSGTVSLIMEYITNSLKPTVIYPYVPLMLAMLIF